MRGGRSGAERKIGSLTNSLKRLKRQESLSASSEELLVQDAAGAGITVGKRLRIGAEVLLVYAVAGDTVRSPPPSLLLPLPMSLLWTPSVDNS